MTSEGRWINSLDVLPLGWDKTSHMPRWFPEVHSNNLLIACPSLLPPLSSSPLPSPACWYHLPVTCLMVGFVGSPNPGTCVCSHSHAPYTCTCLHTRAPTQTYLCMHAQPFSYACLHAQAPPTRAQKLQEHTHLSTHTCRGEKGAWWLSSLTQPPCSEASSHHQALPVQALLGLSRLLTAQKIPTSFPTPACYFRP